MNIDRIISENIKKVVNSKKVIRLSENNLSNIVKARLIEALNEEGKEKDVKKGALKLSNGRRGDYNVKQDKATNPNLNNADNEEIAQTLNNDVVNVAAVARQLYPKLTPEGAQSKLRKKIKHIKSDSGTQYRLKKKEAFKARRIIDKEMNA